MTIVLALLNASSAADFAVPLVDFDGDGLADLAAGLYAPPIEQIAVYYGASGGFASTPDTIVPSPQPNKSIVFSENAYAGDVNGDGYSDLIVGANYGDKGRGAAYVYHGGPDGLSDEPASSLLGSDTGFTTRAFGYRVASAGDVDLDGYDDVIVSAVATYVTNTQDGVAFVYRGGPDGVAEEPTWTLLGSGGYLDNFGVALDATFVNDDAYPDLVIGEARNFLYGGSSRGRVHVFLGGPGGFSTHADQVIEGPSGTGLGFGLSLAAVGDVNLDGFGDVAVGEPLADGSTGKAHVYLGTAAGLDATAALELRAPVGSSGGYFGWSVDGGGDLDLDGVADIVVGETDAAGLAGRAHAFYTLPHVLPGNPSNPHVVVPDATFSSGAAGEAYFGTCVAFASDADGDGIDEVLIGAPSADGGSGRIYVFEGTHAGPVPSAPQQTLLSPVAGGGFGEHVAR